MFFTKNISGFNRFIQRCKRSNIVFFIVNTNLRNIWMFCALFINEYSALTSLVSFVQTNFMLGVFRNGARPKINPSVIKTISIYMIALLPRRQLAIQLAFQDNPGKMNPFSTSTAINSGFRSAFLCAGIAAMQIPFIGCQNIGVFGIIQNIHSYFVYQISQSVASEVCHRIYI